MAWSIQMVGGKVTMSVTRAMILSVLNDIVEIDM
jgi:hypothetical protein